MALVLVLTTTSAFAQQCDVATSGVVFGRYDPVRASATDSRGDVIVRCSVAGGAGMRLDTISIALRSDPAGTRRLRGASGSLAYALFSDATHVRAWGDGVAGDSVSIRVPPPEGRRPSEARVPVYARVPPGQWVPAGAYSDIVVVEITF